MSFLDNIQKQLWWSSSSTDPIINLKTLEQYASSNPFAPEQKTTAQLDSAGNIPLVNSSLAKDNMGLTVEKTASNVIQPTKPTLEQSTTHAKETEKPFVKTGESVDERLTRYYGKAYTNASSEEKEQYLKKYITGHFETLKGKARPEQIQIQLSDYKKLLANTRNGNDYEMMAKKISVLEKENQVSAAKLATVETKDFELRRRGEIGVARAVHECHKDNQRALTDIVVQSGNEEAQKIGAGFVSKINPENQDYAHQAYFDLDKKDIQTILTAHLGEYDKDVQKSIYQRTMTSNYQDVLEFAAKNIYTLHKDNQIAATQMTVATKNEGAINAAASNSYLCDKDNQAEIKSTLTSSGYESVEQTLKESETKQESNVSAQKSEANNITAEISEIIKSNSPNKDSLISKAIQNSSNAQKITLMSSLSSSELVGVLDAILADNPSSEVISKAMELMGGLDDKNKQKYMAQLGKSSSSAIILAQINSMDPSLQVLLVKSIDNLDNVDRNKLSLLAKEAYDERLKGSKE